MTTLHEVRVAGLEAIVWLLPVGGNGRYLSFVPGNRWTPVGHAYRIERGNPPPMGDYMRNHWAPWGTTWERPNWGNDPLQPLCGRIKSQARKARLQTMGTGYPDDRYCADCRRLATPTSLTNLIQNDPWRNVGWYDRQSTPDPITGL